MSVWNGHAIPTLYGYVTFRSRTEARWAVFMDQLGLRWHYEHEGFQLPSGWYLPDFWVPPINAYIEVKGTKSDADRLPCKELAALTGRKVFLVVGSPGEQDVDCDYSNGNEGAYLHMSDGGGDNHYLWCRCPSCGKFGIQFDGRGARVCGGDWSTKKYRCLGDAVWENDKAYSYDHPLIIGATQVAESWRFY